MLNFLRSDYYWLDLLVGFASPVIFFALRRRGAAGRRDWRLFWLGAALGLLWEVPVFLFSTLSTTPVIVWVRALPAPYPIFLLAHTFWDGALFVIGSWALGFFFGAPIASRFRWAELAALIAWGQATSFAVELSSVLNDGWVYVAGYWWNPTLFRIAARPITLLPQIPWLLAPVVFYLAAIKITAASGARQLDNAARNV